MWHCRVTLGRRVAGTYLWPHKNPVLMAENKTKTNETLQRYFRLESADLRIGSLCWVTQVGSVYPHKP